MAQFHPETPLTAVAKFTLGGNSGKVKAGSIVWSSSNPNDVITQVDDADNGASTASIDGTKNVNGETSVYTCTANGNRGGGAPSLVSATSDKAEWTADADIEADGETIGMSQSGPSTPAQAAVHAAAQA